MIAEQIEKSKINKGDFKVSADPDLTATYLVKGKKESFKIDLEHVGIVSSGRSGVATSLAPHAFRLKKNIAIYSTFTRTPWDEPDILSGDYIVVIGGSTERIGSSSEVFSSSPLIKLPDITISTTSERFRKCFKLPDPDKVLFTFKDLKGLPIAYISKRQCALVLLWEGFNRSSETTNIEREKYLDYLFINYSDNCDKLLKEARVNLAEEKLKAKKREYLGFIDSMFRNSIAEIGSRINTSKIDIDSHMKGIQTKSIQIQSDECFLQAMNERSESEQIKKQLEDDYKLISMLKDSGKYTKFRFETGAIVGTTREIKLFDKYAIGEFDVKFYLDGKIRCHNLTHRVENKYDHPHIMDGVPCYGNLDSAITTIINKHQFGVAFDLMYEFLIRYVDGVGMGNGPYMKLEKMYPRLLEEGSLKLCSKCHRIEEMCGCNPKKQQCPHCRKCYEECGCPRCPKYDFPKNVIGYDDVECDGGCEFFVGDDDDDGEGGDFVECTY